jgi:hypothetical protein
VVGFRFLNKQAIQIWKCRIPLKIRIFLWQAFKNRLQTRQQLKDRNWKGSEYCYLCRDEDDVDHLLFINSPISSYCWSLLRETFGWMDQPVSVDDRTDNVWIKRKFVLSQASIILFAGLAWAIGNARKDDERCRINFLTDL